jgi:hypothetical protein
MRSSTRSLDLFARTTLAALVLNTVSAQPSEALFNGDPYQDPGTACENFGTRWQGATLVSAGPAACGASFTLQFPIGTNAEGQTIYATVSYCPSSIVVKPAHAERVTKVGYSTPSSESLPYEQFSFSCASTPFATTCEPGGSTPLTQTVKSYTEAACSGNGGGQ